RGVIPQNKLVYFYEIRSSGYLNTRPIDLYRCFNPYFYGIRSSGSLYLSAANAERCFNPYFYGIRSSG
ncbi:MAG: hypothetical protein M1536_04760, partial [Firmicutes bacterium]|nr:hypothetical protein [Bacillota bacterium]